jgi:hypothetical protein
MASIIKRRLPNRSLGNARHYCEKESLKYRNGKWRENLTGSAKCTIVVLRNWKQALTGNWDPTYLDKEET